MSEEDDSEKQYEATQQKLDEARKKGDFPRSADLTTAAAYLGFLIAIVSVGPKSLTDISNIFVAFIERPSQFVGHQGFEFLATPIHAAFIQTFLVLAPFVLIPSVFAIIATAAQKGFVFSPSKIEPKISKISLVGNVKNKFGRSGFFEFFKSAMKLLLFSVILGVFLAMNREVIMASATLPAPHASHKMFQILINFCIVVVVVTASLSAVDYLFQYSEHRRKNMMSRKELTDEQKSSEGDPHQKNQRRQRGQEIALNQMFADIPNADVVLVNPTHYAVVLKWDRTKGSAPVCVAKGVDEIAARIREAAMEHGIPIHRAPSATRAIFATVQIGEEIRTEHYEAVALAIRFAEEIRRKMRGSR